MASRSPIACALLVAALGASGVHALDQTLPGRLLLVKNNLDPAKRLVKYVVKVPPLNDVQMSGSPFDGGATLEVVLQPEIGVGSQQCFSLPAAGWRMANSIAFTYKDTTGAYGPVKTASFKETSGGTFILKVVAKGSQGSITLQPPARTAEANVSFRAGTSGDRYCSTFGGDFVLDGVSALKAKNAPDPSSCAGAFLPCSPGGAFLDG
jgi:hypothetical protein